MKPLTIKSPSQQSETPKLSIDMAEQIADRAARRAADETATRVSQEVNRENMESFNRFKEQNSQQNSQQVPQQVPQQNVEVEETSEVDIDVFNSGTSKSIKNFVSAYKGLNEIFSPPADPTRVAIESAMSNLLSEFVTNRLGGGGGTGVASHKPSFLMDVLNTAAAHGFGEQLGANLPQVIQSLSGAIGSKKTQELVDNINSKMSSNTGGESSGNSNIDNSNVEKQKDMVLALDQNNPENIKQYASAMGLTEKAAKGMLQIHQDDIINERKIFSSSEKSSESNNEITQALAILIQEMTGMKTVINNLQNELISMKGNNINDNVDTVNESEISNVDDRWNDNESSKINISTSPVGGQNRNVTLFQSPIKVDVDDIKGNSDPFFSEKQKQHSDSNVKTNITTKKIEYEITEEQEKESILEETKDSKGNSSFKMSGEPPKIPEKIIDKKEENSSVELKEPDKTITRKIVKKIIPIKKVDEIVNKVEEVSKKVEHYDINNNLIMED